MTTLIIAGLSCIGFFTAIWILIVLHRSKEELRELKQVFAQNERANRQELQTNLAQFNDSVLTRMTDIATLQKNQFDSFANQLNNANKINVNNLENMRNTVEKRLQHLQDDNNKKLEQMRNTVDEKLHATLKNGWEKVLNWSVTD